MITITAFVFLARIKQGQFWFRNTNIEGQVDFGEVEIKELFLDNVTFSSEVTGIITIEELSIYSRTSNFWSNLGSVYEGSLIKDLSA